jgi:hypothetical protein
MSAQTPLVLAGATMLALAAAACTLNFDRYAAVVDAAGGRPDVGADASPGSDSSGDDGTVGDVGPSGDAGADVPDGRGNADCGAVVQGCTSEAGACGIACGVTSQQCQSQCNNNPCVRHCQQAEQSCRQGCESTCTNCIGSVGCSGNAGCADAAFTD